MIPEKLEQCPECGEGGDSWVYDFQTCMACGHSRMGLRVETQGEVGGARIIQGLQEAVRDTGGTITLKYSSRAVMACPTGRLMVDFWIGAKGTPLQHCGQLLLTVGEYQSVLCALIMGAKQMFERLEIVCDEAAERAALDEVARLERALGDDQGNQPSGRVDPGGN